MLSPAPYLAQELCSGQSNHGVLLVGVEDHDDVGAGQDQGGHGEGHAQRV